MVFFKKHKCEGIWFFSNKREGFPHKIEKASFRQTSPIHNGRAMVCSVADGISCGPYAVSVDKSLIDISTSVF
jgi:hypothetical protein